MFCVSSSPSSALGKNDGRITRVAYLVGYPVCEIGLGVPLLMRMYLYYPQPQRISPFFYIFASWLD